VREGGREADIEEVKNLVRNVIKRPSCLILLVISCDSKFFLPSFIARHADSYQTADIENQGARRLAKEVDRLGHRTIRVYLIFLHLFHSNTANSGLNQAGSHCHKGAL
jgi:hypothetical protein